MIALLDANMLIALFDAAHVDHQKAHAWLSAHRLRHAGPGSSFQAG
jgi:predicted nucleic acid-binding protein